jgi:hypothetical protein
MDGRPPPRRVPTRWTYKVVFPGGVKIRPAPDTEAEEAGEEMVVMPCGEVFEAGTVLALNGRNWVKLSDGRGWVFEALPNEATPGENETQVLELINCTAPAVEISSLAPQGAHLFATPPITGGSLALSSAMESVSKSSSSRRYYPGGSSGLRPATSNSDLTTAAGGWGAALEQAHKLSSSTELPKSSQGAAAVAHVAPSTTGPHWRQLQDQALALSDYRPAAKAGEGGETPACTASFEALVHFLESTAEQRAALHPYLSADADPSNFAKGTSEAAARRHDEQVMALQRLRRLLETAMRSPSEVAAADSSAAAGPGAVDPPPPPPPPPELFADVGRIIDAVWFVARLGPRRAEPLIGGLYMQAEERLQPLLALHHHPPAGQNPGPLFEASSRRCRAQIERCLSSLGRERRNCEEFLDIIAGVGAVDAVAGDHGAPVHRLKDLVRSFIVLAGINYYASASAAEVELYMRHDETTIGTPQQSDQPPQRASFFNEIAANGDTPVGGGAGFFNKAKKRVADLLGSPDIQLAWTF